MSVQHHSRRFRRVRATSALPPQRPEYGLAVGRLKRAKGLTARAVVRWGTIGGQRDKDEASCLEDEGFATFTQDRASHDRRGQGAAGSGA